MMTKKFFPFLRCFASALAINASLIAQPVFAHSVGQVQTTKFFSPDTVQMLVNRAASGVPGLQVGDTVSYIIQFSPIANGANIGVAGYITDYVPPGVEVISTSIVAKDVGGNFYPIAPGLPGGIDFGWGNRGASTYLAPFNTSAYDATGRCLAGGFTNNCNGRITEVYADTGIFYSADPRTAQYPAMPARILQGTNGYNINPTAAGQLNPIIGQAQATTHNLWDADQTNAFGSTAAAVTALAAPKSTQGAISSTGRGSIPFNAGSPVAGPQSGYLLDNTALAGPWQRIAYTGSRIGDNIIGPATADDISITAVGGNWTSTGWNLTSSNPLPSGTNAVRWAVGKLVVGEIRYVKISMRITAPVPVDGLLNSSEVFGGDAGDGDNGQDNTWRYHVPSVADNNSNLYLLKSVACVYSGAVCQPSQGAYIPANAKVRYRIVYLNSGNVTQTNLVLSDTLPCQTAANPVSNINIVSGGIGVPSPNPPVVAAGSCPGTRQTFSFPALASLGPGAGGSIELDVQTNAALLSTVTNSAKLISTQIPAGVTSHVNSYAQSAPNIVVTKTTGTPTALPGGTVSYTILIENTGTAATNTSLVINDVLPSLGGAIDATTRFSYASTSSVTGLTAVVPTVIGPPPTLTPYNSSSISSNQQQVQWNFGAQTLAAGASASITFTATIGANVPASTTPYYNTAVATYGGGAGRTDTVNVTGILVTSPLSVTKTIECYFVGASCVTYSNYIPANAKVRYKIDYANTGVSTITNTILSDTLPCQTAANAVSNITIVSGPITLPATNPPVIAAGSCPGTRQTFSFPAATLNAGQTGKIKMDVQTNAVNGNVAINTATMSGTGVGTVNSEIQTSVLSQAQLQISKTASVTAVKQGNNLFYTLTLTNVGTTNASSMVLYDWLPTSAPTNDVTTRFTFVAGSSVFGGSVSGVAPTVSRPPTQTPYNNVPSGANPNLNNQEQVAWNFGAQTLAPGATFTVTFQSQAGTAIPTSPPAYSNNARVTYTGGQADAGAASVNVGLVTDVSVTKSNAASTVPIGGSTTYTIIVNNAGPDAANNTVIRDMAATGLSKTAVSCLASGGAACPGSVTVAGLEAGLTIPTLPSSGQITLSVTASVTAASGNVTNTAFVTMPAGVYDTNTANNSASDTDTLTSSPSITLLKTLGIISDPVNGTTNPKFIPGAVAEYSIFASNSGGSADNNSTIITDAVPANTALYVNDLGIAGSGPVQFTQGVTSSTLTYGFTALNNLADDVDFSIDGGATWNAVPVPASGVAGQPNVGCDLTINRIRINPKGTFIGNASAPNPSFQLKFRACVQ